MNDKDRQLKEIKEQVQTLLYKLKGIGTYEQER